MTSISIIPFSFPIHLSMFFFSLFPLQEGELRRPSTGYPITHDRRTSAPFLRQGEMDDGQGWESSKRWNMSNKHRSQKRWRESVLVWFGEIEAFYGPQDQNTEASSLMTKPWSFNLPTWLKVVLNYGCSAHIRIRSAQEYPVLPPRNSSVWLKNTEICQCVTKCPSTLCDDVLLIGRVGHFPDLKLQRYLQKKDVW